MKEDKLIVENCSEVRHERNQIIKETLSKVVAEQLYYLEEYKLIFDFHSLSEGYGFIMSLQFTGESMVIHIYS